MEADLKLTHAKLMLVRGLTTVSVVKGNIVKQFSFFSSLGILGAVPVLMALPAQAQIPQITGIQFNSSPTGVEILLETPTGSSTLIRSLTSGRDWIAEISNVQLALPQGQPFRQDNPTEAIAAIRVTPLEGNRVQVVVTGKDSAPTGQVFVRGTQGLVVRLNSAAAGTASALAPAPSPPATASTPAPTPESSPPPPSDLQPIELEVIAAPENNPYVVDQAITATEFDAPLRDIPRSIQVIPEQVIEDQKAIRLEDALRNVSGVSRTNTFGGTADGFLLRAFPADIFRNGFAEVPGTTAFSSVRETANLERIEVLKGPASILFGNVAPGGIINLVTKKPLSDPFFAGSFTVGSFELFRPTIDFTGPITADASLRYRLNAVYEDSSSFRDFTQIERIFIAPVLAWQIGDRTSLELELEYLNDDRPFDRGLVAVGDRPADIPISRRLGEPGDFRRVEDIGVGYRFEHQINDNWTLKNGFRALFSDNSVQRFEPFGLDETTGILDREFRVTEGDRQSYSLQSNLIGKFATGPVQHQLVFGLDLLRIDSAEAGERVRPIAPIDIFNPVFGAPIPEVFPFFDNDSRTDNLGIYLQNLISLRDNLKLLVGGRFDLLDQRNIDNFNVETSTQSDTAFSPTVGLVYQPIQPVSLYASFARSFQPNFAIDVNGDFLEPERGDQVEVGIKAELLQGRLNTSLAFYRLTQSNLAVVDPNNTDFAIAAGEQRSQGIELDVVGRLLPGWNIIASYAFTDAKITESDEFFLSAEGNRFPNIPFHQASLWTTYEIQKGAAQGLGFGLGLFYVGDRQGDFENTFILPEFLRTDAAVFYRRENWRLALNIRNVFDVRIFESSTFRENITPGAPLTFLGTVSVEF